MNTDPPVDYLAKLTDKELIQLWGTRVNRLKFMTEKEQMETFPSHKLSLLEEGIDRVEKEMARRNMPIPGDKTWR